MKFFNASGTLQNEIKLERPPHCLCVTGPDELLIGLGNHFEVYDFNVDEPNAGTQPRCMTVSVTGA